jgi:preprotein translocase subunit SecF
MEFIRDTKIDFMKIRNITFLISGILVVLSILFLIIKGPKYGIDFTGGNLLHIYLKKEVTPGKMRKIISELGIPKAEIQDISHREYIIKYTVEKDVDELVAGISNKLETEVEIERAEKVGPRVGKELRLKAIYAILLGMFFMLIYISLRFTLPFAIAAIIAIFHDVLITLLVFMLLSKDITIPIIAAFLTIVGYSINDTIVVSDRIRENLTKYRKRFSEIANISINQTLSRTLITSGTTLLVLLALLVRGGPLLFDFAFALTIGVIVGTYSSIFIVSALVTEYEERKRHIKR